MSSIPPDSLCSFPFGGIFAPLRHLTVVTINSSPRRTRLTHPHTVSAVRIVRGRRAIVQRRHPVHHVPGVTRRSLREAIAKHIICASHSTDRGRSVQVVANRIRSVPGWVVGPKRRVVRQSVAISGTGKVVKLSIVSIIVRPLNRPRWRIGSLTNPSLGIDIRNCIRTGSVCNRW